MEALQHGSVQSWPIREQRRDNSPSTHRCFSQVSYLYQPAVTLLPLLHVQVPAAWPPQQALRLWRVKQAHAAAVQQAGGQICGAAAAELLTRQESEGGSRSHGVTRKLEHAAVNKRNASAGRSRYRPGRRFHDASAETRLVLTGAAALGGVVTHPQVVTQLVSNG